MNLLFVNACLRPGSRTLTLARRLLSEMDCEITELNVEAENILPLTSAELGKRMSLTESHSLDHPMFRLARQFAAADAIMIAAPFWDLSFPAMLKAYFESITVAGITFNYQGGVPTGLCRAEKLIYVTTAGGKIVEDFGYSYINSLALNFYGIKSTVCYYAEDLDALGISSEELFDRAEIHCIRRDIRMKPGHFRQ